MPAPYSLHRTDYTGLLITPYIWIWNQYTNIFKLRRHHLILPPAGLSAVCTGQPLFPYFLYLALHMFGTLVRQNLQSCVHARKFQQWRKLFCWLLFPRARHTTRAILHVQNFLARECSGTWKRENVLEVRERKRFTACYLKGRECRQFVEMTGQNLKWPPQRSGMSLSGTLKKFWDPPHF